MASSYLHPPKVNLSGANYPTYLVASLHLTSLLCATTMTARYTFSVELITTQTNSIHPKIETVQIKGLVHTCGNSYFEGKGG